jgi:hypothetical protein
MPATEQTWRSQKLLHRVFGVSAFVLLASTMWMFYADHNREWKPYQDTARHMDLSYNSWLQLQYETNDAIREHQQLADAFALARTSPIADELLNQFKAEAERRSSEDATSKSLYESLAVESLNAAASKAASDLGDEPSKADGKLIAAAEAAHDQVVEALTKIVARAKFTEDNALNARKFKSADLDAIRAKLDLAVRDNLPQAERDRMQEQVDRVAAELEALKIKYQAADEHRKKLQSIVRTARTNEDVARKALDDNRADLKKLQSGYSERQMTYFADKFPYLGKKWLTLPILDAFNSPRKIDNLWSDDLTIDYNFRKVRRFDRCTTCHQAMEKTLPGTADKPLFDGVRTYSVVLAVPAKADVEAARKEVLETRQARTTAGESLVTTAEQDLLEKIYGFRLAQEGLVQREDVTVALVLPNSLAATAEPTLGAALKSKVSGETLRRAVLAVDSVEEDSTPPGVTVGDTILSINGNFVDSPAEVERMLLTTAEFGKPIEVEIRRGFANPYTSHPRLDLFVGSTSPHKLQTFACTVCHEGQGSATQFKWASHTPDSKRQHEEWSKEHGWFDNPHWIFPMYAKRFSEASCLKCHHDVTELEASPRFPETPAPKLTHGYDLMVTYGCYGCHEVKGYDGPTRRVGPDVRLEPNYFAAAQQIKHQLEKADALGKLTSDELAALHAVVDNPERAEARAKLVARFSQDAKSQDPAFPAASHSLAELLKDEETPGKLRKSGPSLRFVAQKSDTDFLVDWIREPKHFRPSTKMPQFFKLWSHLEAEAAHGTEKMEEVEIAGMVAYLQDRSQTFDFLPQATVNEPGATDEEKLEGRIARGKVAFQERGCLACHNHGDFEDIQAYRDPKEVMQGPNLTGLGSKFAPERNKVGRQWLYSWIKQPTKYHARTVMPDLYLDPIQHKDEKGNVVHTTDPVSDIVEYLLTSKADWAPIGLGDGVSSDLETQTRQNLEEAFYVEAAGKYAKFGVPARLEKTLKGAEKELLVPDADFDASKEVSARQKLNYIGRKSIAKYGCFGCHDIPGFEDAKPIGTGLADWGRKEPAKLAFEHITHFLHKHGHGSHHGGGHGVATTHGKEAKSDTSVGRPPVGYVSTEDHGAPSNVHHDPVQKTPDFYVKHIEAGHREGFLWQKLTEPRSYDYEKTENKRYNERLRMPKFPFSDTDREAIMTFVLGLVSDPPAPKYIYKPDAHQTAWIKGRQALEKYNCGGCHVLEAERWEVTSKPGEYGEQAATNQYPYLAARFSPESVAKSKKADAAGLVKAHLTGMPALNDADALPVVNDVEGDPVENDGDYEQNTVSYPFELWQPTLIDGQKYEPGIMQVNVAASKLTKRMDTEGGVLARYLLPHVTQREKQVNPAAKGTESWAWVPPPLVGEGQKVQSQWLHNFLLNPYPIRPAVVLRMPRFNMSAEEASDLAEYFARNDGAEFPYAATEHRLPTYLAAKESAYQAAANAVAAKPASDGAAARSRLQDAMRMVTNSNYCVKCHIVGDYVPSGADRAKAPNLARIYERLRPGYLRDWIANPKRILPYTSMPVNIPYDPADTKNFGGISQDLYHGTSIDQVDALVDLLMNYDNYAKDKTLVAPLVQQAAPPAAPEAATGEPATAEKPAAGGGG